MARAGATGGGGTARARLRIDDRHVLKSTWGLPSAPPPRTDFPAEESPFGFILAHTAPRVVNDSWDHDVLRSVPDADPSAYVRGQYEGYREVNGVEPGSETETYAALRLGIDNWRWAGVPFLIRTGKALPVSATEVDIRFRLPPAILMGGDRVGEVKRHNHMTLRIGPEPGASLGVMVKAPGEDRPDPVLVLPDIAPDPGQQSQDDNDDGP